MISGWGPLCRHSDREIRLPATGNYSTCASRSWVRPLAAMPNGFRAGNLVETDSTNQRRGSMRASALDQQLIDHRGALWKARVARSEGRKDKARHRRPRSGLATPWSGPLRGARSCLPLYSPSSRPLSGSVAASWGGGIRRTL